MKLVAWADDGRAVLQLMAMNANLQVTKNIGIGLFASQYVGDENFACQNFGYVSLTA